jgi:cytochrome b pre-mRNA-processing protein 3
MPAPCNGAVDPQYDQSGARASAMEQDMQLGLIDSLFARKPDDRDALRPLYAAVLVQARDPFWYTDGVVADTVDGRFEMIAAILSLAIIRLEHDPDMGAAAAARLTELFVDDMDPQLREIGIGDMLIGKHVGKMMSALGGRLSVYRAGLADPALLDAALVRNLYRGVQPSAQTLSCVHDRLIALYAGIEGRTVPALISGQLSA